MSDPIHVAHFSDVLCIWAYVAEARMVELEESFAERVVVDRHFCQVFGDTETKVLKGWADRGGPSAYGDHVRKVAAQFEHAPVHAEVWNRVQPKSSMPCHLYLLAVRRVAGPESFARACWAFREAFFRDARDISEASVRHEVAAECGLPVADIEAAVAEGSAHAELTRDLALVKDVDVRVSPSLVFNQGRQRLNGNVGYRIIEANIRELLERPVGGHSWC